MLSVWVCVWVTNDTQGQKLRESDGGVTAWRFRKVFFLLSFCLLLLSETLKVQLRRVCSFSTSTESSGLLSWSHGYSVHSNHFSPVECEEQNDPCGPLFCFCIIVLRLRLSNHIVTSGSFVGLENAEGASSNTAVELWKQSAGWVRPSRCCFCYLACLSHVPQENSEKVKGQTF